MSGALPRGRHRSRWGRPGKEAATQQCPPSCQSGLWAKASERVGRVPGDRDVGQSCSASASGAQPCPAPTPCGVLLVPECHSRVGLFHSA